MKSALAIILSSLIFSILHGYLIIDTILFTILGIIWTYPYFKKKNLLYSIILHFLHKYRQLFCTCCRFYFEAKGISYTQEGKG